MEGIGPHLVANGHSPPERDLPRTHGRYAAIEPRVRALVAEGLGVDPDVLDPEVSLAGDLAADSLDVVELTVALEEAFGAPLSDAALDGVRTYGDLVAAVAAGVDEEHRRHAERCSAPLMARVRVVAGPGRSRSPLERSLPLTPYAVDLLTDDAVAAGPGARLELTVLGTASTRVLARASALFARAGSRGVNVEVRGTRAPRRPQRAAAR